jgi:N-acetylglucosaminyldiphosphoundecaprenol N-acetyl-beta-D-mannosaminyltransferase
VTEVKDDSLTVPRQSRIFELPIELGEPEELLERIIDWVGTDGPTRRVMYVNAHVINQSLEDPALRSALEHADLVYCDGYGVRLAAKALSTEIPHRMTGADWIWDLAAMCEQRDTSVYLLGCEPGVARQAGQRLRRSHPNLRVVGTHHGYFEIGSGHDERVIEDINRCKPDILLVGMGTPKQEIWAQRTVDRLECSVLWSVGALFDFVSGRVPRAPASLADNGLEWIFRLAIEPQRMWRRYLVGNPVFLSRVVAQARQRRDR